MPALRFDDPCATARDEATPRLARGLELRPTLLGFERDEPTLYVRSAPPWVGTTRDSIAASLVMLPRMLGIKRVLVVSESRVTDPSIDDPVARDAQAERGVLVARAEQHGDERPVMSGQLLTWQRAGSHEVVWDPPIELDDGGPWDPVLTHAFSSADGNGPGRNGRGRSGTSEGGPGGSRSSRSRSGGSVRGAGEPGSVVYGLSRLGVVVAVAPGWRERYGLDRPVDPRGVRREDRRRAQAYRSAFRPTTVEAAS